MPQTEVMVFRDSDGTTPLREWLDALKISNESVYAKCLQRILALSDFGYELRRPLADLLRDGIYELRIRNSHINYRMLYFFSGKNAVVLTHGLTKEGAVPNTQIDLAVRRRAMVNKHPDKHTADWE